MLTEAQFKRLPKLLQEIVEVDRELGAIQARVVTPFDRSKRPVREFELIGIRAGLREGATQRWGHKAVGGPAHA